MGKQSSTDNPDRRWLSPAQALDAAFVPDDVVSAAVDPTPVNKTQPAPVEDEVELQPIRKYGLMISGLCFSIPSTTACQVAVVESIDKLINAPRYVLGLSNLSGSVVPVFDLSVYFGFHTETKHLSSYVLLIGKPEDGLGILLDRLPSRLTFNQYQRYPPPPIPELLKPYVLCSYCNTKSNLTNFKQHPVTPDNSSQLPDNESLWLELDVEQLLAAFRQSDKQG